MDGMDDCFLISLRTFVAANRCPFQKQLHMTNNAKQKLKVENTSLDITMDLLKEKYAEYNRMYFNGILPKCKFCFILPDSLGGYSYDKTSNGYQHRIGICKSVIYWDETILKEILIHEMIHLYVQHVHHVGWDGVLGHGWRFRKQVRRLRKEYGLRIGIHPPKTVRYRKKKFRPKLWEKILLWIIDR